MNSFSEDFSHEITMSDLIEGASLAHLAVEKNDILSIKNMKPALVMQQDRDGETPLHYAATNGHLEMCKILVNMNPEIVHIKDLDNKTAFDWAVAYNIEYNGTHQEVCDFLKSFHL